MNVRLLHERYASALRFWRSETGNRAWQMVRTARAEYRKCAQAIFRQLADRMGIAYASVQEDHVNDVWCYHIFTDGRITLPNGDTRKAGDTLCHTRDKFKMIADRMESNLTPDCPRCLQIAERILKGSDQ
jgi:hypothetical protein